MGWGSSLVNRFIGDRQEEEEEEKSDEWAAYFYNYNDNKHSVYQGHKRNKNKTK